MTSGQYSYLMLKKMQAYVSCKDSGYRAYLYNFYGEIFNDPSVFIDEESFQEFMDLMDYEMDYCAKHNLITPEEIYNDANFGQNYAFLQNAFRAIDIQLEMNGTSSMNFTLPSGEQKILTGLSDWVATNLTFHSQLRVTDEYLSQMRTYYLLENEEAFDLSYIGTNVAGYNTYWTYDESTKTLEISGNGSLAATTLWSKLGIADISTIILGTGVNRLTSGSLYNNITIVDLHGEMDEVIVDEDCINTDIFGFGHLVIYSDNISLRRDDINWCLNGAIIEWHSLSEWQSEAKMYSYNGVRLPKLPDIPADAPYVCIWLTPRHEFACIHASNVPFVWHPGFTSGSVCQPVGATVVYTNWPVGGYEIGVDTEWGTLSRTEYEEPLPQSAATGFYETYSGVMWANHNIFSYEDGTTLFLAKSDPVPVYE